MHQATCAQHHMCSQPVAICFGIEGLHVHRKHGGKSGADKVTLVIFIVSESAGKLEARTTCKIVIEKKGGHSGK